MECHVDSNPQPSIRWAYYVIHVLEDDSIEMWNNYSSGVISFDSVISICVIYDNVSQWAKTNGAMSLKVGLGCLAGFDEFIAVGGEEFEMKTFEQIFADECLQYKTEEPSRGNMKRDMLNETF